MDTVILMFVNSPMNRIRAILVFILTLNLLPSGQSILGAPATSADTYDHHVTTAWADMAVELIRGASGFTPPVASRALGYLGVTLWEAAAPGIPGARSLAGQLNGLETLPLPAPGEEYSWPLVVNSAAAAILHKLFAEASAQQHSAINGLERSIAIRYRALAPRDVRDRSRQFGQQLADAIFEWSKEDGGAQGHLRNFPETYRRPAGENLWEPTPPNYQRALLPTWGDNRPFVLETGAECAPPPPPAYSTDPASPMFLEAMEVYTTVQSLTPWQLETALYWADDPNLTATPPGHWWAIATQVAREERASMALTAEMYARLGIAVADSFIGCWNAKFTYNQMRPITYIQRVIDPAWNAAEITDPVLTPPFPDYTSGHATESGAAARVLSHLYGENYTFVDRSQARLGFAPRAYASFEVAAEEAALSRLYGGIHFRTANEMGLMQGRCIGHKVLQLTMRQ
jgi:hypothetical protein